MSPTLSSPTPGLIRGLLRSPWLRPLNDPVALDDLLGLLRPTWSITSIKARVVEAVRETADARTLVLEPNRLWPGHAAGQHVLVEVEIDGRRLKRTFSLSSPPRIDGLIAITVKRREGGRVSQWWNDGAAVGDVVTVGEPSGEFVLPAPLPARLTMLSAGSGITPVMAMLRELDARDSRTEVLFVHCAHSRGDAIFADELERIADERSWLRLRMHLTGASGRLDHDALSQLASEAADAPVFVCGPEGFTDAVRDVWVTAGRSHLLHFEHFGLPPRCRDGAGTEPVVAARSGSTFVAAGGQSLLEAAEAAGLKPAYGCRMGICHTCKCRKISGVVEDLRDGRLSDEPGEMIQLCVSAARSAVALEL
jgi:stearoyl-CoA 9-desaturase NADPH oxidoreductase